MKELPSWTVLDPDAPPGMAELSGGGHVVGIVVTGAAHRDGWAAGVATRVAQAWSAGGIRLILADGALADPRLHVEVGIENGEGVSDALVFGASVRRVARRVEDQGYFLVAAGTVVADPSEAMSGGRWAHLCSGFRAAGVMLAVYLNADDPSTAIALQEASQVLVVAGADEEVPPVVVDCAAPVLGVIGIEGDDLPSAPVGEGVAETEAEDAFALVPGLDEAPQDAEAVVADDAEAADAYEQQYAEAPFGGAGESPDGEGLSEGDDGPVMPLDDGEAALFQRAVEAAEAGDGEGGVVPFEEILLETEHPKPGRRRERLLLVLLLLVVGALAAEWFGYIEIPGLAPFERNVAPPTETEAAPLASGTVTEQTPMQGYSVALAAYGDAASAQTLVDGVAAAVPDVVFMVVPVDVGGQTYYRALAGPATDSAGAAALSERIASATGSDPTDWVLRPTPQAFELGEMPDVGAARQRAAELRAQGLPAYVLAVDYSDGSSGFRVYGGAFANEAEASVMLRLLTDSGLGAAQLSDRKGRLPE